MACEWERTGGAIKGGNRTASVCCQEVSGLMLADLNNRLFSDRRRVAEKAFFFRHPTTGGAIKLHCGKFVPAHMS
jgi:hypothetical protein